MRVNGSPAGVVPVWTVALRRQRLVLLSILAVLTLLSWLLLIREGQEMDSMGGLTMGMNIVLFLAVWVVMMAAMMFPAAAPMVLAFARVQAGRRQQGQETASTWIFVAAYLGVWSAVGVVAYAATVTAERLGSAIPAIGAAGPRLGGLLILTAGIYHLTPLKRVCLRQCRSPLGFVLTSWRNGTTGALQMGMRHGLYCLGCCWLLFAILFPLGMMNVALLAAVTLLIFGEKTLPYGDRLTWVTAGTLILYGSAVLIAPDLLPMQPPHSSMTM